MAEPTPPPAGPGKPGLPPILRGKVFGMPRWLFATILVGGIVGGLYLRSRQAAAAAGEDTSESTITGDLGSPYADPSMAGYDALAGSGVLPGPANGAVLPVNAPTIPEGFPEVFAGLGDVIGALAGGIADSANPPVINVTTPPGQRGRKGKKGDTGHRGSPAHHKKKHKPKVHAASAATGGGPPNGGGNKAHAIVKKQGHAGVPYGTPGHWIPGHWANPNDKKHSHWIPAQFVAG